MRQILTRRFILALGLPIVLAAVWWLIALRGGSDAAVSGSQPHVISYTASVVTIQADANWAVKNGFTTGSARLAMDDGRTLFLAEAIPAEVTCTDRTTSNACVLLAEMLGDAPVWFALTPAKGDDPTTRLDLPPIVDMLKNGDEAVLSNGWIVPLATPTKRVCDTATSSLRDFIERFSEKMQVSLNLATDEIDTVRCTAD